MKLVTGANGFLGRAIMATLKQRKIAVRGIVRASAKEDYLPVGEIGPDTNWIPFLEGIDTIIHTAARVHVMDEKDSDSSSSFRRVNVAGTRRLAMQAAMAGVRRLVFVSSIKVNGGATGSGKDHTFFTPFDSPRPEGSYGQSKWEAEQALDTVALRTGMEVVVIRPPLIYGPGVQANFLRLIRLVQRGWPIPLGAVDNRRSLVALDNLVDLIIRCIDHPAAAGQIFLVSDGHDLSTPELITRLAHAMEIRARLVPIPPIILRYGARLTGCIAEVERLIDSLQVDIHHTCVTLDWQPSVSVEEGIRKAVAPLHF